MDLTDNIKAILIDSLHCKIDQISTKDNTISFDINRNKTLSIHELENLNYFKQNYLYIDSLSGLHDSNTSQRLIIKIFNSQKELDTYLEYLEELKKLDHRYIGTHLKYFILDPVHAPGMIIWLEKGLILFNKIKSYMRNTMRKYGYKNEVCTPVIADLNLYSKSGHVDMYHENIFFLTDKTSVLKPMNCPFHILIFKNKKPTYKDLPMKISEFGSCSRNETKSALHGLFRARGFTQDDSHIFCTEDHIEESVLNFCSILREVYNKFGFEDIQLKLSTRPDKYVGDLAIWKKAEEALACVAKKSGISFEINHGDGAFYGPKLDFYIKDNRGRVWQCGTVQLDFMLARKLEATYIDHNNEHKTPVMIHHAVLGSIERFMGILIEHHKGKFPLWLAPMQVSILPINNHSEILAYCENISKILSEYKISNTIDSSNETLNAKIRKSWADEFIPISIIIGNKEIDSGKLALRINGEKVNNMQINQIIEYIRNEGN